MNDLEHETSDDWVFSALAKIYGPGTMSSNQHTFFNDLAGKIKSPSSTKQAGVGIDFDRLRNNYAKFRGCFDEQIMMKLSDKVCIVNIQREMDEERPITAKELLGQLYEGIDTDRQKCKMNFWVKETSREKSGHTEDDLERLTEAMSKLYAEYDESQRDQFRRWWLRKCRSRKHDCKKLLGFLLGEPSSPRVQNKIDKRRRFFVVPIVVWVCFWTMLAFAAVSVWSWFMYAVMFVLGVNKPRRQT
ncbi:hypothetical protein ACLMJK_001723 [Lecanora helva]